MNFIFVPLYISVLSAEELGVLSILQILVVLGQAFFALGINYAVLRFLSAQKEDSQRIMNVALSAIIILGMLFCGFTTVFAEMLNERLFQKSAYYYLLILTIWTIPFEIIWGSVTSYFRIHNKINTYNMLSVVKSGLTIGLTIGLVVYGGWALKGILIAKLLAAVIVAVVAIFSIGKFRFQIDLPLLKKMSRFGFPLIIHITGAGLNEWGDKFILQFLLGLEAVGIYSMAYRIAQMVCVVVGPFTQAWIPYVYNAIDANEMEGLRKINPVGSLYISVLGVLGIVTGFFGKILLSFFDKQGQYLQSLELLYILIPGLMFGMLAMMVGFGAYLKNKTYYVTMGTTAAMLLNLLLNFILIPQIGLRGAALATVFSNFLMAVIAYLVTRKFYRINFRPGFTALFVCVAVILSKDFLIEMIARV